MRTMCDMYLAYQSVFDALEHLHFNKNAFVIMYNFVFIARFNMNCDPLFLYILVYQLCSSSHTSEIK